METDAFGNDKTGTSLLGIANMNLSKRDIADDFKWPLKVILATENLSVVNISRTTE